MNIKYLLFALLPLLWISCSDDDPDIENPEEVITTVRLDLTEAGTSTVSTFLYQDLDGPGGDDATRMVDNLKPNTVYTGAFTLLNEQEDPAEDITAEIAEEDDEHQFFFITSGGVTVSYTDQDGDGNPIGLATTLTTGDAGSASLQVTLRHEPEKDEAGVSDGEITNAGGETDIQLTWSFEVQ